MKKKRKRLKTAPCASAVVETDIPERMQISEAKTGTPPTDDGSIVKEAKWIKEQLPELLKIMVPGDDLEEHIKNFLKFSHVERLDLPYIAMYRMEDISSLLKDPETGEDVSHDKPGLKRHKVLWAVHNLDTKWLLLQKRKKALEGDFNTRFEEISCGIDDKSRLCFDQQVYESIISALTLAESERELDDVVSKFNLHFPLGDQVRVDEFYPSDEAWVNEFYRICKEAGLWKVASKFGCSSKQLVDEMEDPKETPEDVASNFASEWLNSVEAVLTAARFMATIDLIYDPRLKKHLCSRYFEHALVSTFLISDGNAITDASLQFRDKPLNNVGGKQCFHIQDAERKALLQVTIELPEENLSKLISESEKYYISVSVSELAQLWNVQRKMILADAIINYILPELEKEARLFLTDRAKNWLLLDYGDRLWDKVSVAPYRSNKREFAARVMGCCWGSDGQKTTFVMLDSYGEIEDKLEVGSNTLGIRDDADKMRLREFMKKFQPQAVVVGAGEWSSMMLQDNIREIVLDELDQVIVVLGDESLPVLYAKNDFVERVAAVGKYLQNPLAMVANLCDPSRKVLSWEVSPLQKFLDDDNKYAMVEQIMVDVTNQVGIHLNQALRHEWLFAPMQFISGLGPMKAEALKSSLLETSKVILSRNELMSYGLGGKVFENAVGFLGIWGGLDATRIHPCFYDLALEMVKYIYKTFSSDVRLSGYDDFESDDGITVAIWNLRDNVSAWNAFDVDAYAKESCQDKLKTLRAIKLELIEGFEDWRKPYVVPTSLQGFHMIFGDDVNVDEGHIVNATVCDVRDYGAKCQLDSGVPGVLWRDDCPKDWRDVKLTYKLRVNDKITCQIKRFNLMWYSVQLSYVDNGTRSN